MELENKNGVKFNLTEEEFLDVSAAGLLLEQSFIDFEGEPKDFIELAKLQVPQPMFLDRTEESLLLGNSIFIGICTYGKDFIDKMLKVDDPTTVVFSLFNYSLQMIDSLTKDSYNNIESEDDSHVQ